MKTKQRSCLRAGPLFLLLVGLAPPVLGQTVGASLTGTVTDNTGAVLTKASVVAVHRSTGVEYPTQSNDSGVYTITGLPIGTYVVKAESPGFKSVTTNPLKLEVGQIARVNLKLEVGAVTEQVEVTGVNPILQTENAVVGEIISGSTIVALPLNGRNFAQLTLLAPGVQTHAPDTFTEVKTTGVVGSGRPYVNGQREQSNNFMLDGIDQNEAVDNLIAYYPSPDAIAEMKVDTNNYSAEYGNVAGGVVNVVTKSGSNEFHGSAFTFARDDKFDANSWANNRSGAKKGNFTQQIFGATLGGPLARNKLFFFVDYQGTRIDRPGDTVATVAPAEWRNGDFSSLLARGVVIRDPLTGLPFPNNQVPTSRFSPAARALLGNTTNYPLPNRPGVNGLTGNFVGFQDSETRNHQGDLRIDANLSPSDNLSIRGSVGTYHNLTTETVFPLRPGGGWDSDARSVAVNWAHTWPAAVNELRVGWSHVLIDENPTANVFGLGDYNQTLGIPGGQVIPGLSEISFGNSGIDGVGNIAARHFTNNNTFQISEKLSLSRGRHFLSVGGQFLHYRMGQDYASNSGLLGSFRFNQPDFTGFGFSDFLLDQVGGKQIGRSGPWTQLQNRIGVFVQDDLKVGSRLTLNLGLRWEYASPIVEKDDKQVNWDIETGEQRFAGQDGNSRALYDPYYGGFSPRLGLAWTPNDKTVLRGGYGMVQYMEGTGANCRLPLNIPFFGEFTRNYTGTPGSLATGFSDVRDLTRLQLRVWQTDLKPQLTQQWNAFVERQVSDTTSLNVGYVGSKSTRVVSFGNANQPLPGVGDPSTWAPEQQRRPFPQYGFWRYTASDAKVNYHGLQTSLRRRRANGLEFLASYTLSKALTDNVGFYGAGWGGFNADEGNGSVGGAGNLNFRDKSLDYGPAWFSSKHTGAFSASYELPVGKGRSVGSDWSGLAQALLGGWNVSSILTVRSGLPITVLNGWGNISLQHPDVLQERPDRIGDGSVSDPSWDLWLDRSAFRDPAPGQFGNSGVGILRGPGFYNIDLGIDKNFDLGASRLLTLRIEAFNVLNHSNKGLPIRDVTDPNFGRILGTANRARVLEFAGKFIF
jgi:outer membrane receptor protein involved in Fe transport